jgi:hypothetical protein
MTISEARQASHPNPQEHPPLPDWKKPENHPGHDLPSRRIEPTIQPTEPWKDPEPRQPTRRED